MYAKNMSQRVFICTMAILLPLLFTSLVAHGLATAEGGVRVPTNRPTKSVASGITSDDFNSCELNTGLWTFEDPLVDSSYEMVNTFTDSAALSITVPGGARHSISRSNTDAPRMMQAVSDGSANFTITTKIDSAISQTFQIQGILVKGSETDEFIRFDYFSDGTDIRVYAATLEDGITLTVKNDKPVLAAGAGESYFLRVERNGDQWTQSYKKSAASPWFPLPAFTYSMTVAAVGPYAGNSADPPSPPPKIPAHTALFDYFFNADSPIVPEDGDTNSLTLNANPVTGGGVSKDPDSASYACNEAVKITASPNEGWDFTSWSGDFIGSANPVTVTMTGSRQITATFIAYSLDLNIAGNGGVVADPAGPEYTAGTTVTLTATADPGWTFTGWSGDLLGTANPETITIDGNKSITATFSQDQYTITSTVEGEGIVSWVPLKDTYVYSEVITITASPNSGWTFTKWGGDLSGSENPKVVTMTGDLNVTAIFEVRVLFPIIIKAP